MRFVDGNVLKSDCDTIVNTVNCRGVMGKGLALEFKNKYPEMFEAYKQACNDKTLKIGQPQLYKLENGKQILNFPTKDD